MLQDRMAVKYPTYTISDISNLPNFTTVRNALDKKVYQSTNDASRIWQGLQDITDYKVIITESQHHHLPA